MIRNQRLQFILAQPWTKINTAAQFPHQNVGYGLVLAESEKLDHVG